MVLHTLKPASYATNNKSICCYVQQRWQKEEDRKMSIWTFFLFM